MRLEAGNRELNSKLRDGVARIKIELKTQLEKK